jgi:hypothetical protein
VLLGEGALLWLALGEGVADHWRMLRKRDREGLAAEVAEMGRGRLSPTGHARWDGDQSLPWRPTYRSFWRSTAQCTRYL